MEELSKPDIKLLRSSLKFYHTASDDTSRINALNDICENMMHDDWEKYQSFQLELIENALEKKQPEKVRLFLLKSLASNLNNMGYTHLMKGKNKLAFEYYKKAKQIAIEVDDKASLATYYLSVGFLYNNQGGIKKALEHYFQALKLCEETGDDNGVANSLQNIAGIYDQQGELDKALEYCMRSLKVYEKINDKRGVAYAMNSIGVFYYKKEDMTQALNYYLQSLTIRQKIGDRHGLTDSYNNIGSFYKTQQQLDKALSYYYKSLAIQEEIEYHDITATLNNIASIEYILGNSRKAKTLAQRELKIAQELGFPSETMNAAKLLSVIYQKEKNGKKALNMYKLFISMRDSLNNEATQKASAKQQAKYEYEKQKTIDDAEHDKQLAVEQEEKEKQQILTAATAGGLGLVIIFLVFVFNRLQITKKQKLVIQKQKQEVEQQKTVVEAAHHELEEKNQEIMDSITYAKRIQSAILPPDKVVKEYLKESFILYKPKDVVAGDFYWLESVPSSRHSALDAESPNKEEIADKASNDELVLFAAADCTGHGVPGAMVSVVCNNALNRSIREHGLTDPGEILNKTREIVIQEFEKSEEEVKDGMDIALCSLEGNKLQYAGAHNPLWIIRPKRHSGLDPESPKKSDADQASNDHYVIIEIKANLSRQTITNYDGYSLLEVKADKQPIGKFDNPLPYTTHTFELLEGDTIYIFSDGYVDQFGGAKGKKFKAKAFRELLLSIQEQTMEQQRASIDHAFETWKGNLEQIDDVCVIGVKI